MPARISWWSLFLCAPPLFSGCAALAPAHKDTYVTIRTEPSVEAALATPANFLLVGRISVTGGKDSFSGAAQWRHSERADEILLLSPLGQTLAQIQLDPDGAYLTTSEHQSYYAPDVESLTEQVLGWRLPLMTCNTGSGSIRLQRQLKWMWIGMGGSWRFGRMGGISIISIISRYRRPPLLR
jgi:outer membrane lipoprotein LolB